jgi:hypothetical protein
MSLHGALHLAPIKDGLHDVLDIATGTGIWAIDFGKTTDYSNPKVSIFSFIISSKISFHHRHRHRLESHPARIVSLECASPLVASL